MNAIRVHNWIANLFWLPLVIGGLPLCAASAAVQPPAVADEALPLALMAMINQSVDIDSVRLIAIFKDLHQHPEIAFNLAAIPVGVKVNTVAVLSILARRE